jgi:peptidoglycan-N-acetylglucosamine deacetylase
VATSRQPETPKSDLASTLCRSARHRWDRALVRAAGAHQSLDAARSEVALTFDDGPDPKFTPGLLDSLDHAGILATFFWIGDRAVAHRDLARRVRAAGHSVGSHSSCHLAPSHRSEKVLRSDYLDGRRAVEEAIGEPTSLFRPPFGAITPQSVIAIRRLGLEPWLWSVDSGDWRPGATATELLVGLSGIPGGSVVLLHDGTGDPGPGASRAATIELIEPLADALRSRGLSFVTLDAGRRS